MNGCPIEPRLLMVLTHPDSHRLSRACTLSEPWISAPPAPTIHHAYIDAAHNSLLLGVRLPLPSPLSVSLSGAFALLARLIRHPLLAPVFLSLVLSQRRASGTPADLNDNDDLSL